MPSLAKSCGAGISFPPAEQRGVNAAGTPQYGPSGVPIWAGMAMDEDHLYIATGDDYSGEGSETSDAIIALDKSLGQDGLGPPGALWRCMEWILRER